VRSTRIIGWDIGGAHVKAALVTPEGRLLSTAQVACPLWLGIQHLHTAIDQVVRVLGDVGDRHAITMTGEMADIFSSRTVGVKAIVDAMVERFSAPRVQFFAGRSGFLPSVQAKQAVGDVASANWLASASWVSLATQSGLLVDIGSTTTDLISFAQGKVEARGSNDSERLRFDELVYTGVVRTPLMALAQRAPVNGDWLGVMAEQFATSADIYRILHKLTERIDQYPAADQGEKSITASERRLARMLGMDAGQAPAGMWHNLARYFEECQLRLLMDACARVLSRGNLGADAPLVGAGVGRFLAATLAQRLGRPYIDFNDLINHTETEPGFDAADCAPAVAVAVLLQRITTASGSAISGVYA
jgi:probable H4MPT-linked C1 transfer pathway protein